MPVHQKKEIKTERHKSYQTKVTSYYHIHDCLSCMSLFRNRPIYANPGVEFKRCQGDQALEARFLDVFSEKMRDRNQALDDVSCDALSGHLDA
jgi:hypothetical protein